jgi:hypothetical protein
MTHPFLWPLGAVESFRLNYIPVWDVWSTLDEGSDNTTKCQQRLIDIASFTSSAFNGPRTTNVLTPGQIDQVQFANLHRLLAVVVLLDVNSDGEDGMRATRMGIH